ncbi:MAG: HAD family acid phosphatase [Thermodesulfobacteriota bacterium]
MISRNLNILLLFAALALFPFESFAKKPENLHTAKQAVILYHDSGEYDVDQEEVAQQAISYLANRINKNLKLPEPKKLAIVFDIDETSLSNYKILLSLDFAYHSHVLLTELEQADDPAINPTLELYQFAKEKEVAIFFITGRPEKLRLDTEENLKRVGYTEWNKLFLKPDDYKEKSVIPYKSGARKSIEAQGYHIVVNIGDQWSDLAGGFSERVFKIPNPYYYVP